MRDRKLQVALIEFPSVDGLFPLASGYLQAYALKDPELASQVKFTQFSWVADESVRRVLREVQEQHADVYAFSCYVWNMGLVKRVVKELQQARPHAHIVLGGPQVMNHGSQYLSPEYDKTVICNGEGERTFSNLLCQLVSGRPDLTGVKGLSMYRDGSLLTTEPEARIMDLNDIPSPFLGNLFEKDRYTWANFETNRGCPFKCTYCYWGAATASKVVRFETERVKAELDWLTQYPALYYFCCDANFGMLPRDLELAEHIATRRKETGFPRSMYFNSSKNTPERVSQIIQLLKDAELMVAQPISLQTMSADALKAVDRSNIRSTAYVSLQKTLNNAGVASFVELIWPLPGETLASFKEGVGALCEMGADSFVIFPLILLHNVPMTRDREKYGLVTVTEKSTNSEAEIAIGTNLVNLEEYKEGLWFGYSVTGIYSNRGLGTLGRYLHTAGIMPFTKLLNAFSEHCKSLNDAYSRWVSQSLAGTAVWDTGRINGGILHKTLHEDRAGFDQLLASFVSRQAWWDEPEARLRFEIDLISRPYVYNNTDLLPKAYDFEYLKVDVAGPDTYAVELPGPLSPELRRQLAADGGSQERRWLVRHRGSGLPFMTGRSEHANYSNCEGWLHKIREILPHWTAATPPS